jgi:hypothetical protein
MWFELSDDDSGEIGEKLDLFGGFSDIELSIEAMKEVLNRRRENGFESAEAEKQEVENLMKQVYGAVEALELSRKTQVEKGLVEKASWKFRPENLEEVFSSGAVAMEIDVHLDSEAQFWVALHAEQKIDGRKQLINQLSSEQMEQTGRMKLDQALEVLQKYQGNGSRLILELKTLGPDNEAMLENLKNFQAKLAEFGVEDSVSVASLSPDILAKTHDLMPDMPLIMNSAVAPLVSYPTPETLSAASRNIFTKLLQVTRNRWVDSDKVLGMKGANVKVCTGEGALQNPAENGGDGWGKDNMYLMTEIPAKNLEALREQTSSSAELGGAASMAAVTIAASILDFLGADVKAANMRKYYADKLHELGVNIQTTTWGGMDNSLIESLRPENQIEKFKEAGIGDGQYRDIIYTKRVAELGRKLAKTA